MRLTKVDGYNSIVVVVDRFFKYATFISASKKCHTDKTTELFVKYIVKYWGMPKSIVSYIHVNFIDKFWIKIFRLLESDLLLLMSFRPQIDKWSALIHCWDNTYDISSA